MRNLLLLFSFGLSYVCNGQHAIIKGTVESENKEPLPYASVYIKSLNLSTTSNNNGDFQLKVPEGRHELSCHYIGFKPKT
ncbi:MAG: carboxypeptidase-like regulatory domain-containing protein, partial [Bacteroidota bacterium]